MPLLDSFTVDHTKMIAPAVRVGKKLKTQGGDIITVFDLRFCIPNKEKIKSKALHTLEHLFAGYMREYLNGENVEIIDISPMGCRTGFYMSLLGEPSEQEVARAWEASMNRILELESKEEIPAMNQYQCGSYKLHSLKGAKKVARKVLKKGVGVMENAALQLNSEI